MIAAIPASAKQAMTVSPPQRGTMIHSHGVKMSAWASHSVAKVYSNTSIPLLTTAANAVLAQIGLGLLRNLNL
jgi:hypothetical protein